MQKTRINIDKKGRYELWRYNRKGYYNFVRYLTEEEAKKYDKK